jgi:hypothetical protein
MGERLLPDAAVQAIQDSVKTEVISVEDREYVTRQVFAPPVEPLAQTLAAHTLTGLIDYLSANIDAVDPAKFVIHIEDHDQVELIGQLDGRPLRRDTLLVIHAEPSAFRFNQYYSCEDFNIALQSLFVDDGDREGVLKVVGNIREEAVAQHTDDGVSQSVVARAGLTKVENVAVPNPVTLRPYRTFPEVPQPASVFVLRLKRARDGEMPQCALFEADGGKWKLDAIQSIAQYLRIKIAELKEPLDKLAIIA